MIGMRSSNFTHHMTINHRIYYIILLSILVLIIRGRGGGELPSQKKKRRRERGRWERGGGSIYLGIMIASYT